MKPNNPAGAISYSVDDDQIIWMEASWNNDPGSVEKFANLLYEIHSGELLEDTLRFLKAECVKQGTLKVYQKILIALDKMFLSDDLLEEAAVDNRAEDAPVVSPTEVALNYLSMF